jgi:hypothetical protein
LGEIDLAETEMTAWGKADGLPEVESPDAGYFF